MPSFERSTPPREEKALPDVAPVRLEEGRAKKKREQAEKERLKAWIGDHRWRGAKLQPWSLGRDRLWLTMCAGDVELTETWGLSGLEAGHAIKLLFLASTPSVELMQAEPVELIERAEAWGDVHVTRQETKAAVELAREIRRLAFCTRSSLKPAERRGSAENAAVPVADASYLVMLAGALQGAESLDWLEWEMTLARGHALIHGRWIYDGAPTRWSDRSSSKTAAWLEAWRKTRKR